MQKYGPTVLAAPTAKGFNRVAWVMPFVALGFGLATVVSDCARVEERPAAALPEGRSPGAGAELERFRDQARKETEL